MTGTVLVVDDNPNFRSLYELWLAEYDVRTAADGVAALDEIDASVDVVVLDREMPRKDGLAVARELETQSVDPAVVMISGVTPGTDLLDVPVDDYLQKPVEREAVDAAVRRGLAVADSPTDVRKLLALDTRINVVEASVDTGTLAASDAYHRATAELESELTAFDRQRANARPTADGDASGALHRQSAHRFQ